MTYKTNQSMTPFLDVLFSLLICCLAVVLIVNHKNSEDKPSQQYQAIYSIVMEWPVSSNDDIDLWSRDSQGRIVGFNRREGGQDSLMNLNHDNLGRDQNERGASLEVNQEIISIRGVTEGEYIVNAQCYEKRDATPTTVVIKLVKMKPFSQIFIRTNIFSTAGEEFTFFRFTLDKD